jgi:hypothetical protein
VHPALLPYQGKLLVYKGLRASVVLVVGLGVVWLQLHWCVVVLGQSVWAVMTWQAVAYLWRLWWLVVRLLGVSRAHHMGLPL